jgi:hypothetical protein
MITPAITRRDFLKTTAGGVLAASVLGPVRLHTLT